MASVATTIRMDADLKQQFEETCADMGMNVTTAINVFAKKVVREQKIPFEITAETPNDATVQALEDASLNRNLSKPFNSVDELMKDLYADD